MERSISTDKLLVLSQLAEKFKDKKVTIESLELVWEDVNDVTVPNIKIKNLKIE